MAGRRLGRVAVGVSGGVDSAVAALTLRNSGYDVHGVFMRNWDELEEGVGCSGDADAYSAKFVCKQLGIKFSEMNFVKEYWNEVFVKMIEDLESGMTPNPDILCNKTIKFGSFLRACEEKLDVDWLATGHYARVAKCHQGEDVALLQATDARKDQTFFLSQVSQHALRKSLFPLGSLLKSEVRQLAEGAGLSRVARRKESMGICFVGKRSFGRFVGEYVAKGEGGSNDFIDVDTGRVVGQHKGSHLLTEGQTVRAATANSLDSSFTCMTVVEKQSNGDILVCGGKHHPALYSSTILVKYPHFIRYRPPILQDFQCEFRMVHGAPLLACRVSQCAPDAVRVETCVPVRAVTPGQYCVFYLDGECLGSAVITGRDTPLHASAAVRATLKQLRQHLPVLGNDGLKMEVEREASYKDRVLRRRFIEEEKRKYYEYVNKVQTVENS